MRGFSLIELVLIVVVVGILALATFYFSSSYIASASNEKVVEWVMDLKRAVGKYINDSGSLPQSLSSLVGSYITVPQEVQNMNPSMAQGSISCDGGIPASSMNTLYVSLTCTGTNICQAIQQELQKSGFCTNLTGGTLKVGVQ